MRYLSLFSGIEAATAAWHPLGWKAVAYAEIEPFPCAVLQHRYQDILNLGDVTGITEQDVINLGPIDVIVFGSPCQDLSVAGKRKGLDGERSGLFFTAMRIIDFARKHCGLRYALWENVPGAFSSNRGADFAAVVEHMAGMECEVPPKGWGTEGCALGEKGMVEWSTLDAQWFGVAQRRRRVFALADFGDWRGRCPILLESESLRGDSPPRREAGQEVAPTIRAGATNRSAGHGSRSGDSKDELIVAAVGVALRGREGGATAELTGELSTALRASGGGGDKPHVLTHVPEIARTVACREGSSYDFETTTMLPVAFPACLSGTQRVATENLCPSITAGNPTAVAIGWSEELTPSIELAGSLQYGGQGGRHDGVMQPDMRVRRLTPRECERLQGFPDDYTLIPYRNKQAADGPRYKALGNSMAVPVMRWIGEHIEIAEMM